MARVTSRWGGVVVAMVLGAAAMPAARGQEPAVSKGDGPAREAEAIRPMPIEAIPDNPPPHEGALFELPYRIGPGDVLRVEAIEALPGRPISGERSVRSDGTISLRWYGELHVAGLTERQAKAKLVVHLRKYLTDEVLGLVVFDDPGPLAPLPAPGTPAEGFVVDDGPNPEVLPAEKPKDRPEEKPKDRPPVPDPFDPLAPDLPHPVEDKPASPTGPKLGEGAPGGFSDPFFVYYGWYLPRKAAIEGNPMLDETRKAALALSDPNGGFGRFDPALGAADVVPPGPDRLARAANAANPVYVAPDAATRVSVEVVRATGAGYDVAGEVGRPGRFPWTGKETVLEALQYAGLLRSADRAAIRLNRPARGGQPVRSYRIDLDAILGGDARANLQLFPGDRVVVPGLDGP